MSLPLVPALAYVAFLLVTCAAVASVLILAITRLLTYHETVAYALAWRCSFAGLWQYMAVTLLMKVLVTWFRTEPPAAGDAARVVAGLWHTIASGRAFSAAYEISLFATLPPDRWPTLAGMMLLVRLPGALLFARILSQRLARGAYGGFSGFVLASGVAFVTAELSFAVAGTWLGPAVWRHVQVMAIGGDARLAILVVYSAVLLLPCAFIGGLLGGRILLSLTRSFAREPVGSYGDSYSTVVRALLVYGFLTVLAIFLFRDADPVVWRLAELVFGRGLHDPTFDRDALKAAFVASMILQLPGVFAAGAVIARRQSPVYDGAVGYAKGCLVAAVTCVAICVPFWTAALRVLPSIVTSVNGRAATLLEPFARSSSRNP